MKYKIVNVEKIKRQSEYTINQIAEYCHLPKCTIRYYDSKGLLPKITRFEDGRRGFSKDDVETLKFIACLKDTGMTLENIKKLFELRISLKDTSEEIKELLIKQQICILQKYDDLLKNIDILENTMKDYYKKEIDFFKMLDENNKEAKYTIGKVAELTGLSAYTLRYYDDKGILPFYNKVGGIRKFSQQDIEKIKIISRSKNNGMPLKIIKQFIDTDISSIKNMQIRYSILENHIQSLYAKKNELEKGLCTINYKIKHYKTIGKFLKR